MSAHRCNCRSLSCPRPCDKQKSLRKSASHLKPKQPFARESQSPRQVARLPRDGREGIEPCGRWPRPPAAHESPPGWRFKGLLSSVRRSLVNVGADPRRPVYNVSLLSSVRRSLVKATAVRRRLRSRKGCYPPVRRSPVKAPEGVSPPSANALPVALLTRKRRALVG